MISQIPKTHCSKYEELKVAIYSSDFTCLTGLPTVCKTTMAKKVLSEHPRFITIYIHCNDIATPSKLYSDIFESLPKKFKTTHLKDRASAQEFADILDQYFKTSAKRGFQKIFVILDQVELFRKTPMMECINVLLRIKNVKLIVITNEMALDILDYICVGSPRVQIEDKMSVVDLSPFDKSDLIELILCQPPKKCSNLYEKFVNNVVNIVYNSSTKDYVEIRSFCQENFVKFLEFYRNRINELIVKQHSSEPELTELDDELLDDWEISSHHVQSIICSFLESFKGSIRQKDMRNWDVSCPDRKLNISTTILIVATYIAAYTKPSDDNRNFVKFQKRRVSRKVRSDYSENLSSPFTLERLLHIYKALSNLQQGIPDYSDASPFDLPDSILGDVQTLQDLAILHMVSGNGHDSLTRFKISSLLSRDYVERIATQVGLSLGQIFGLS